MKFRESINAFLAALIVGSGVAGTVLVRDASNPPAAVSFNDDDILPDNPPDVIPKPQPIPEPDDGDTLPDSVPDPRPQPEPVKPEPSPKPDLKDDDILPDNGPDIPSPKPPTPEPPKPEPRPGPNLNDDDILPDVDPSRPDPRPQPQPNPNAKKWTIKQMLDFSYSQEKYLIIFFKAKGCVPCEKMLNEEIPRVSSDRFHIEIVDVDQTKENADLFEKYGLTQTPSYVFLAKKEFVVSKGTGFRDAQQFSQWATDADNEIDRIVLARKQKQQAIDYYVPGEYSNSGSYYVVPDSYYTPSRGSSYYSTPTYTYPSSSVYSNGYYGGSCASGACGS